MQLTMNHPAGVSDRPGPGPADRPASADEQMQGVFHELHPDGHNALCAVCAGQYGTHAARG